MWPGMVGQATALPARLDGVWELSTASLESWTTWAAQQLSEGLL